MKKILFVLLCLLFTSAASYAQSKGHKPRIKARRAFSHATESDLGKNSRARFRRENNILPTVDLNPHRLEKFKTARANKNYKFSKGQ
ncbi:MAG: hypothetical protein NVS3B25_11410 [Hymenobacter sp.]